MFTILIYPCSLGLIVSSYLQMGCNQNPLDYCKSVVSRADQYSGFNLITANFRFISYWLAGASQLSRFNCRCFSLRCWRPPYLVYRARPSLPARVVPRSIIVLCACSAEGREGLAEVISFITVWSTYQIILSRSGKQLVHNSNAQGQP